MEGLEKKDLWDPQEIGGQERLLQFCSRAGNETGVTEDPFFILNIYFYSYTF